jgi:hypothetical protein
MIEKIGMRAIVMGAIALMLVAAILFGLDQCRARQTAGKQAEVSKEQGQASINAGAAAMNTVSGVQANDAATDAAVAEGQAAIRNAPQGQKGAAAKSALCKLKTYRDTPQCKEPPK